MYAGHPYFDSHCLNKDVPSVANQFDMDLLKAVIGVNMKYKDEYLKALKNS